MSSIIAIDPGPVQSAIVHWHDGELGAFDIAPNAELEQVLTVATWPAESVLVIERVASFGMAVGEDVFETVYWTGRFAKTWDDRNYEAADRMTRHAVKMFWCKRGNAKDSNITQAIVDRFGGVGGMKAAKGTKAKPGPLHGVTSHVWAALALAIAYDETRAVEPVNTN